MKLSKKNLKALPGGPTPMPLEEKIEMYQKKGCNNIDNFLSNLTTLQREALWQKVNYNRKADPKVQDLWQKKCNGAGSMPEKKKLLNIFIQQGLSCKGQPLAKAYCCLTIVLHFVCVILCMFQVSEHYIYQYKQTMTTICRHSLR
jgi:hypothetical protein